MTYEDLNPVMDAVVLCVGYLQTDFTRTGKRTIQGAINDGINSCVRFYLNNFEDGLKQDAIDLMLGRYRPDPSIASPFISPPADQESFNVFLTKVFVCMVLTFSFLMLVRPKGKEGDTAFFLSSSCHFEGGLIRGVCNA